MWYTYIMKFYSVEKKNEVVKISGRWIDLESITFKSSNWNAERENPFLSYADLSPTYTYA